MILRQVALPHTSVALDGTPDQPIVLPLGQDPGARRLHRRVDLLQKRARAADRVVMRRRDDKEGRVVVDVEGVIFLLPGVGVEVFGQLAARLDPVLEEQVVHGLNKIGGQPVGSQAVPGAVADDDDILRRVVGEAHALSGSGAGHGSCSPSPSPGPG